MYSKLAYDEEAHDAAIREDSYEEGIRIFVEDKLEDGVPRENIIKKLQKGYGLSLDQAGEYVEKYAMKKET